VGRVVDLNISYDQARNQSMVAVLCEFGRDKLTDADGVPIDVSSRAELEQMVERGLRAQLGVQGLATGLLFVELDFQDPEDYPAPTRLGSERFVVVPYVPSTISEFQNGISEVLANLRRVDLAGLARDLSALATTARREVEGVDFRGVAEQWKKTGAQVEALAANPEIGKTIAGLNQAANELRATIAKLDAQIEPTGQGLSATLEEARQTMQAFNRTAEAAETFISTHGGLGEEVVRSLNLLNQTADAVKRLAEFLERNPNALITGRKLPQ